jgi:hypothetical protein
MRSNSKLLAAAAVFGLLVVPVALGGPASVPRDSEARASASVDREIKKLKQVLTRNPDGSPEDACVTILTF